MGKFGDILLNTVKDSIKSGAAKGIRAAEMKLVYGNDEGITQLDSSTYSNDYIDTGLLNTSSKNITSGPLSVFGISSLDERERSSKVINNDYDYNNKRFLGYNTDYYKYKLPRWGYDDFINERSIWLRHISNGFDEPNWMFFRIFFDFDTYHGLLGGVLNSSEDGGEISTSQYIKDSILNTYSINSASSYLTNLKNMGKYYQVENIDTRLSALHKFVQMLSNINTYSPWIFKGVGGLNNAANPVYEDMSKEKIITLDLNVDTVDWRLTTLLSLYKYACYDEMNQKEILPDNLRKFDMNIVIFSSPIKYIHTPVYNATTKKWYRKEYKKIFDSGVFNMMSTKVLSFYGCELKPDTLGSYVPGSINNESPFQLGKSNIQIAYDRMYEHTFNEFENILIGTDGMYCFDKCDPKSTRQIISTIHEQPDTTQILTASEYYGVYRLNEIFGTNKNFILGNIFGQSFKNVVSPLNKITNGNRYKPTEYFAAKQSMISGTEMPGLMQLGFNWLYNILGSSFRAGAAPGIDETGTVLNGKGELGVGSEMYFTKLRRLLYGPEKYPQTAREDRLSSIAAAKNFNIYRWASKQINKNKGK